MKKFFIPILLCVGFIVSYELGRSAADRYLFAVGGLDITSAEFDELAELLDNLEIVDIDDGNGNDLRTVRFTGVNVQIVNGLGATNGYPTNPDDSGNSVVNGLGNLIIGYNEEHGTIDTDRTGSHNIVVGLFQEYTSYANTVLGRFNSATSEFGLVHGNSNTITSQHGATIGGQDNSVTDVKAVCVGGRDAVASNDWAVTIGGQRATASGGKSVCVGGLDNEASGSGATVTGGDDNIASGNQASVSGGQSRSATGDYDWRAGSLLEDS